MFNEKTFGEEINLALQNHQKTIDGWECAEAAKDLHKWQERIIFEFKLEIPLAALSIEYLRKRILGYYRPKRNGFGLQDEIAINKRYLHKDREYWRTIGTLAHEQLHSWQKHHGNAGKRNYHNKEFQKKALSIGLIVNSRGYTQYDESDSSPFRKLLKKYGVEVPKLPVRELPKNLTSKLKLYKCSCGVNVRIGRSRFNAKCLDCNGIFILQTNEEKKDKTNQVLGISKIDSTEKTKKNHIKNEVNIMKNNKPLRKKRLRDLSKEERAKLDKYVMRNIKVNCKISHTREIGKPTPVGNAVA